MSEIAAAPNAITQAQILGALLTLTKESQATILALMPVSVEPSPISQISAAKDIQAVGLLLAPTSRTRSPFDY